MKFEIPRIDYGSYELSINTGSVMVFVGANGSGKTRLGFYLEEQLFLLTNQGLQQKQLKLDSLNQELKDFEYLVNTSNLQLMEISNFSDEEVAERALKYQASTVMVNNYSFYSRLEIANLAISGKFPTISFNSNEIKNFPPKTLDDICGGQIIVGELQLEVDLLKVVRSDPSSISAARDYQKTKLESLINVNQKRVKQLTEQIQVLETEINTATQCIFNYCERISAHRSLVVNENLSPKDLQEAVNTLHYGDAHQTQDTSSKWGRKPFGTLLSDFDKLVIAFLSEEANVGALFRQSYNGNIPDKDKPNTNFDKALAIWNRLLPHRRLKLNGLSLKVETVEQGEYAISEMSEGERSLFYILGKCLFAKPESLIIIDEPDIHIHKAILSSFFDLIESARSDCAFVYITHDLEFAISRRCSKIYALRSYQHVNRWELQEIQSDEIPEIIYTRIYGSRRSILFVEGRKESLDNIYKYVYPDLEVVPVGTGVLTKSGGWEIGEGK
jgi:ABC-type lipoprotein export system ATPase subunit